MSEKADIVAVRLPWIACEMMVEHGAVERLDGRVHLVQF
jgi:hypothetical protein